jgi:hypothetical protein
MLERVVCLCVLFCVLASADDVSDIVSPMWAQLRAHTSRVGDLSTIKSFDRRTINAVKNTTECEIRLLAYEHALHIVNSQRAASKMVEVFDALQLSTMCSVTRPTPIPVPAPSYPLPTTKATFFVDHSKGDDKNSGAKDQPFATVTRALAATRSARNGLTASDKAAIVLRAGTHFLNKGLNLTSVDSGLIITNFPGEESWVSGGVPLKTKWLRFNTTGKRTQHFQIAAPSANTNL